MLAAERMIVGLDGEAVDEQVIRYAAMVARLVQESEPSGGLLNVRYQRMSRDSIAIGSRMTTLPIKSLPINGIRPEVRFVSMLANGSAKTYSLREILEARVEKHFRSSVHTARTTFDVLKLRPLKQIAARANDFDSDLLLVDEAIGTGLHRARLAVSAPCSVWFVPSGSAPVLRRILIPIDFTTSAVISMRTAIDLASRFRPAKCFAVYVEPRQSRFTTDGFGSYRRRGLEDEFAGFMKAVDRTAADIEPLFVCDDHFGRAIERCARECSTDLTVFAARRRSRLASLLCRSRTETALRHGIGPALVLKVAEQPVGALHAVKKRWNLRSAPLYS